MNRIRSLACILGALAASMLALGAPAFATRVPPAGGWGNQPAVPGQGTTHLVVVGGMPGWQITLITAAAALAAATLAVLRPPAPLHPNRMTSSHEPTWQACHPGRPASAQAAPRAQEPLLHTA